MTALARDIIAQVAGSTNGHTGQDEAEALWLPPEFWQRPVLAHIRYAARQRFVGPDAVLAAVLARVVALSPHTLELPPTIGAEAGLTLLSVIVGSPGKSKSSPVSVARRLLPGPPGFRDMLPIGSGEGLVESLFEMVDELSPDGKKTVSVKRQVHHSAYFHVDEGAVLTDLGQRKGATLMPTLRSAWSGYPLGNTNADTSRRRIVDGGQYVFGLTVAAQWDNAAELLRPDQRDAGTPQRLTWTAAGDPAMCREHANIEWPGPLDWAPPSGPTLEWVAVRRDQWVRHPLVVPTEVRDVILDDHIAVQTGAKEPDPLDLHRNLVRLKQAAALALLEGRVDITCEDWDLAGVLMDTSDRVRAEVLAHQRQSAADAERAMTDRRVRVERAVATSKEERALVSASKSLAKTVHKHGGHDGDGCPSRCASRAVASAHRDLVGMAAIVDEALGNGWVIQRGDRYFPGPSHPA